MTYETEDQVGTELRVFFPNITDPQVAEAFKYYKLGLSNGSKVLGLLDKLEPLTPILGTIFDDVPGVLCTGNGWSIHINDGYILGGVHAHAKFWLVERSHWMATTGRNGNLQAKGQRTVGNQLDYVSDAMLTDAYGPFKVTQREILALNIFGYESNAAGMFTCSRPALANQDSFANYIAEVNEVANAVTRCG